jgi:tetratricopeptide (TPR) repeat protein
MLRAGFIAGGLLLGANSAYLALSAAPTLAYFANVIAHPLLGLAVLGFGVCLVLQLPRRSSQIWIASATVTVAAITGLLILIRGAVGAHRWLLDWHVLAGASAAVVVGMLLARAAWNERRKRAGQLALVTVLGVVTAVVAAVSVRSTHEAGRQSAFRIVNAPAPDSMDGEGGGPTSPFFPSSALTTTGGLISGDMFLTSASCGRCHRDIYEQWRASVHHFSSFNNQWYRKSIEYMQDVVGTKPSKWCAGCHDHAVLFNGRFDQPIKDQIDTPEAQAGLGCLSCHAITRVNSTMGQGDFVIEYPALHDIAVMEHPVLQAAHDTLLEIDPQTHRETFLKPFHREQTSEFCASCHKVHLDVPVNAYRWLRGFNDYDNWQASGVSGEGARSFYYPPAPQGCRDCHMPRVTSTDPAAKNGLVRSHRFAAANTAIPFVNHDQIQLDAVQRFLQDGQISVDIFGLVRGEASVSADASARSGPEPRLATSFAVGEESAGALPSAMAVRPAATVVAPLAGEEAEVRRGESVRVEVVVRTRKVGHFFPAGTVDAFDVWVELEAIDDRGQTLLHSGALAAGDDGPVDPAAHFYRSLLLDEHGGVINKRNAWAARSTAYVRLIPPGAADTVHYRLQIPEDAGDSIQLRARVNYRKFSWWFTQWAYGGVRDPSDRHFSVAAGHDTGRWLFNGDLSRVSGAMKQIPKLPVTVMATSTATLRVLPPDRSPAPVRTAIDASLRERWNDYGIGLLLQGDLKGAEAAFERVTEIDPSYADGWVNIARARLDEGNTADAVVALERARALAPELAKTHYFLGIAFRNLGRYDDARAHFERARSQYPRDRVVRNQLGRVLFLQRKFADAVEEFEAVLAIDPEDLQAHYNLMLCYRGTGASEQAARHERLYLRFKADEPSQAITGPFRQLHSHDNNERQLVHEHGASRAPGAS